MQVVLESFVYNSLDAILLSEAEPFKHFLVEAFERIWASDSVVLKKVYG